MRQILLFSELKKEIESCVAIAYSLKQAMNSESLASLLKTLDQITFLRKYAGLSGTSEKKLARLLAPCTEISALASPLYLDEKGDFLLSVQLIGNARGREKTVLNRVKRDLARSRSQAAKQLIRALNSNLTKIDLEALLARIDRFEKTADPDPERQKTLIRKKYLMALLPVQIYNAEGQLSSSAKTFDSLYNALNEIHLILKYFIPAEDDSAENLGILKEALGQIRLYDRLQVHLRDQVHSAFVEVDAFHARIMAAESPDWGGLSAELKFPPLKEMFQSLKTLDKLRRNTISNVLLAWEDLEYQKTWFKIFNQSFN